MAASTENLITSTHSHIKGLGIDDNLSLNTKDGIIGQHTARKQLYTLLKLLKTPGINGAIVHGNTGKSALVDSFIKDSKQNAYKFHASKITNSNQLVQKIRKAIRIKIDENNTVICGEVIDIKVDKILLKTVDMESEFTIGRKMIDEMLKEKIAIGDVIKIIKETGKIEKLGKSFVKAEEYDALGADVKLIMCPEGEIVMSEVNSNYVSLNQMDVLNNNGHANLFHVCEVAENIKKQVDAKVMEWIDEGKASMIYDILVIEDINLLSEDCVHHLISYMNSKMCPFIIGTVKGTIADKHGAYLKLRDYFYMIKVEKIEKNEIVEVLNKIVKKENMIENDEFISKILEMCDKYGLKYVRNIIPFINSSNTKDFLGLFDN